VSPLKRTIFPHLPWKLSLHFHTRDFRANRSARWPLWMSRRGHRAPASDSLGSHEHCNGTVIAASGLSRTILLIPRNSPGSDRLHCPRAAIFHCVSGLCGGSRQDRLREHQRLSHVHDGIFARARHVESGNATLRRVVHRVCIPRSVELLDMPPSGHSRLRRRVIFESGSILRRIENSWFHNYSLDSICVPRSVESVD
jgi:hypothetical protein